jgi:hypothetical protein
VPAIPEGKRALAEAAPTDVGELTFALSRMVDRYVHGTSQEARYQQRADALSALLVTLLEFHRIDCGPYEDGKYVENGNVFTAQSQ